MRTDTSGPLLCSLLLTGPWPLQESWPQTTEQANYRQALGMMLCRDVTATEPLPSFKEFIKDGNAMLVRNSVVMVGDSRLVSSTEDRQDEREVEILTMATVQEGQVVRTVNSDIGDRGGGDGAEGRFKPHTS